MFLTLIAAVFLGMVMMPELGSTVASNLFGTSSFDFMELQDKAIIGLIGIQGKVALLWENLIGMMPNGITDLQNQVVSLCQKCYEMLPGQADASLLLQKLPGMIFAIDGLKSKIMLLVDNLPEHIENAVDATGYFDAAGYFHPAFSRSTLAVLGVLGVTPLAHLLGDHVCDWFSSKRGA
jgi:hypothetical protein